MDFWHCHKPDERHLHDHTHDEVVGQKGYAAGNRLQVLEGVGFVDLTSFLLREQDCEGARVRQYISALNSPRLSLPHYFPIKWSFRAQRRRFSLSYGIIVDTIAPE